MRFGVSVHASRAWSWYEVSQGADKDGPMAGVPYDGKLTRAQGKGQWWDGLDPQDLYEQRHAPGRQLEWDWDASKGSSIPDRAYCERYLARTIDLIDRYEPDMVYFDDHRLPLDPVSDVGLRIAAHFYNRNMQRHGGRLEAVLTGKVLNEAQRKCMVWDIERGVANELQPLPFQTDTCIGDWHYSRPVLARHGYKSAQMVAQMLVDIVSKNGNLMLSVPVRGDGTIDEHELAFLEGMSDSFLAEPVAMMPGAETATKSRFELLLGPKEHEMHHRGQLMQVQRMIGLVPHLTRQMQERMAQHMQQAQTARA